MPNIVGGRVGLCGGTPYALRRADRLILWRSRDRHRHRHRSVLIAHQATFLGIAFRSPAPQLSCAWLVAFDGPTLPRRRNNRMPSAIARVGRRSPALRNPAASILVAHVSHPGSQRVSKNRMHAQETPMAPNRSRLRQQSASHSLEHHDPTLTMSGAWRPSEQSYAPKRASNP